MITVSQIRQAGALTHFSDEELESLLGAVVERSFSAGEVLCAQGRPAVSCFVVLAGVIDVVRRDRDGERVIAQSVPGSIVGQLALVDREPRIATLRASAAGTALELTREAFRALLASPTPLVCRLQLEVAAATGRQLRDADRRLTATLVARGQRPSLTPVLAEEAVSEELARLKNLRDAVANFDVPFDVVEVQSERPGSTE
ncbi:MAG: cyclic nucleotide-binding domain-containing protein [Polyangiales bacterium]